VIRIRGAEAGAESQLTPMEIPSVAKATLKQVACGGTEVPPFQNGQFYSGF
jgi:hypothetical protein